MDIAEVEISALSKDARDVIAKALEAYVPITDTERIGVPALVLLMRNQGITIAVLSTEDVHARPRTKNN